MPIHKKFVVLLLVFTSQIVWSQDDSDLPEGVMATRGEGSVSVQLFEANLSKIPEKDRTGVLMNLNRIQKLLADLLITSQLKVDAQAAGFDKGLMQYRMQLAADKELTNAWIEHYVSLQEPADYKLMAHEYYLLNMDKMMTPPSRDVTHMLVSNKGSTQEDARKQARIYLDEIEQDPSIFEQLILDHSEDPSAKINKGHFKTVKEGDMVRSVDKATFELKNPGDFSDLVQSPYGVHILRLDAINQPRAYSFDEVEKQLVSMKEKEHKEMLRYKYLNELGTKEWNVSEKELEALADRYLGDDEQAEDSKAPNME
jgi:peptidyl-prolyl cis-trans isomerase C